jgi:hypothetical protein
MIAHPGLLEDLAEAAETASQDAAEATAAGAGTAARAHKATEDAAETAGTPAGLRLLSAHAALHQHGEQGLDESAFSRSGGAVPTAERVAQNAAEKLIEQCHRPLHRLDK